ncbi:Site-specific DNA recombinase [Dehalogenimonas formicexedens]|uniref:Site-specific DNA recombinase n=1 Tax=Dehalogenimonas formicexedens TaxID=1839801 RepID=A0A1P8F5X5_9CHLR|nr:recombinase family protein [Dehalogenimonas formicexedens]APV43887.1 Site-specific DNA recombinase [Dehalogenimonas formicexedens]
MNTGAIYARVSTEDQATGGTSLGTQVQKAMLKAQELGWNVPEGYIITEDHSGKDLHRPGLKKALELARSRSITGIIFFTLDRLYRPDQPGDEWRVFEVLQRFQDQGVKVEWVDASISSREGPFSGVMMYLDSWRAGEERRKIIERTVRGKKARASEGRMPQGTGKGIFGYDYDVITKTRRINEAQASTVRQLFDWTTQGYSIHGMAKKLNGDGIQAFSGGRWHPLTIRRIVTNSVYAGQSFYGRTQRVVDKDGKSHVRETPRSQWIEMPGVTPAIITDDKFQAAQAALGGTKRRVFSEPRKNLLSGYIHCGVCGHRLTGSVLKQKYAYYYCRNNWERYGHTCSQGYVKAPELEARIWQTVGDILQNPDLILSEMRRSHNQSLPHLDETESKLKKESASLAEQEKRLVRLYALGEVNEMFILQETRTLKTRQDAAQRHLEEIRKQRLQIMSLLDSQARITEACQLVSANLARLTFDQKRLALEAIKTEVWVYPDRVELRGKLPTSSLTIARTSASQHGRSCQFQPASVHRGMRVR